jgi:hypothetical protein
MKTEPANPSDGLTVRLMARVQIVGSTRSEKLIEFVPRPVVTTEHRLFPIIIAKQGQVKLMIT